MSLHDPKFRYRPSYDTDIGRHLRRFKREQAEQKKAAEAAEVAAQDGQRRSAVLPWHPTLKTLEERQASAAARRKS